VAMPTTLENSQKLISIESIPGRFRHLLLLLHPSRHAGCGYSAGPTLYSHSWRGFSMSQSWLIAAFRGGVGLRLFLLLNPATIQNRLTVPYYWPLINLRRGALYFLGITGDRDYRSLCADDFVAG